MTGQVITHYRILEKLGEGAMGVVYKAEDTKLRRTVALKFLPSGDSALRDRFLREAQAAAALNHPNICTIYEIDEDHGFLAMELVEGPSLQQKIAERPLKLEEAIELASQIAQGLKAAHVGGVTHRDIKSANILLTEQGHVKITDFGLAALADRSRITKTGMSLGTPAYMAPEQARGDPTDRRTDIWSLGVVLYEMLTGLLPFRGDHEAAVANMILTTDPEPPTALRSGLPIELDRILAKALTKEPGDRYQNADDLRVDLRRVAETISHSQRPVHKVASRQWIPWGAALAASISALTLGVIHFGEQPPAQDPVAFSFSGSMGASAVSPDGSVVVYPDAAPKGTRMLAVRPLAAVEARFLEGTEGATQPFWSPDGRFIGFFARGKLWRIPAGGGPVAVICDVISGRGASWSRSDDIIFQPESRLPLHLVKASGGVPKPITKLDSSRLENSHRYPWFLPDGRHFLYLARATPENTAIFMGSIDGRTPRLIFNAQSNAAYARGYLFFVRDGTLYRQTFDVSSFSLTGEAEPVAQNIEHTLTGSAADFSVSANGRTLAYVKGSRSTTPLIWFDRSGTRREQIGSPAQIIQPRLSPDDRQVVFSMPDPRAGTRDLWMMDLDAQTTQRITLDPANDWQPTWSGDGASILFQSDRKDGIHKLYRQAAGGSSAELIYGETGRPVEPVDWSRDGRYIVFVAEEDLFLLDLRSPSKPIPFAHSPHLELDAKISPDGRWIVHTSNKSGQYEIYLRSFDGAISSPGSELERQISTRGGASPRWRADGRELFYVSPAGSMMSVETAPGDGMKFQPPREVFKTCSVGFRPGYWQSNYDVSSDGRRFLFACPADDPKLVMHIIRDFKALPER